MELKEKLEDAAIKNIAGIQLEYFFKVLGRSSLIESVASRSKSMAYLLEKGWVIKGNRFIMPLSIFNDVKNEHPTLKDIPFHWQLALKIQYWKEIQDNF